MNQNDEFIFIDKPAGFSTHSPDIGKVGLVEIFEKELNQKLYVVHRLDKTTTGAMMFASSEKKAQELFELFKNHRIQKKYLFVTDRASDFATSEAFSVIEKKGNQYTNKPCSEELANAHTRFVRRKRSPFFELWEAYPVSGKPHQIRLHAAQIGLPILGDTLYQGTSFPHLCLHSLEIKLDDQILFTSHPPTFFERMGLLRDPEVCRILSEFDRRQRLFQFLQKPEQCFRLMHTPELTVDVLGDVLWVNWYFDQNPSPKDLDRWQFLGRYLQKKVLIRKRLERGQNPNDAPEWKFEPIPTEWTANENSSHYVFRSQSGLSSGLFLDQRDNRQKIRKMAKDKSILNLFAYTCGFSLEAALGGAREVVSVDLSQNFLEWGKTTFNLNGLDPSKYEFFSQDAQIFLKGTVKRERRFDLIVCDPPSFGRKGKEVFKLEKEFKNILELCDKCLKPGGTLLFSCNLEKWDLEDFKKQVRQALPKYKSQFGRAGWDFEEANEEGPLKVAWLTKSSS